jgi:excinuclease ABC subunit C
MSASRDNPALPALRRRIAKAPTEPGVYRWLDSEGNVLYVGKAKNLKDRLKSYVTPAAKHTAWKEIMMRRVCDVDLTVVNSELEAFVLETNLIKQFRPKFNIMMKDDKNYVYVKITMQDRFPRIDVVRQMENDGSKYFGPKTSADLVRKNLSFLRSIFPFRTCKMEIEIQKAEGSSQKAENSDQLPLDVICTHRDRPTPCLDYHIKQCSAPCIGTCTPEQYRQDCIDGVIDFFEGKYRYQFVLR